MSAFNCTLNTHYRIVSHRIVSAVFLLCSTLTYAMYVVCFDCYFLCTISLAFHLLFSPRAASLLLNWLIDDSIDLYVCTAFRGTGHGQYRAPLPQLHTSEMWYCFGGKGILKKKLSLCYSIVYHYNGAQWYEQFLQVGFDLAWFSSLSSERFCIFDLHGAIMVVFLVTSFSLPFSELSLVGLALDLVD